jgi:hypothetical protein
MAAIEMGAADFGRAILRLRGWKILKGTRIDEGKAAAARRWDAR